MVNQFRSVTACILPEFAADMFANLGWGWGGTLLALVALLAVPAPAVVGDPVDITLPTYGNRCSFVGSDYARDLSFGIEPIR